MRNALGLIAAVLLATSAWAPASFAAATKYKPCSLLRTMELETALAAKLIPGSLGMLEDENIYTDGPLQGQPLDHCIWKLKWAGAGAGMGIAVTLYAARAIGPLPQLATFWYLPKEELIKEGGGSIESARFPGAECRIFKDLKMPGAPGGHETSCLVASKGIALVLEVATNQKTPVAAQLVNKLLDQASGRLP